MRKIVAVIGDAKIEKPSLKYDVAFQTGKLLVDNGFRVQSGGHSGVMEAAFAGAHSSEKYREGDTIAILPGWKADNGNPWGDICIPTGLHLYRNAIVAGASAVIAVGGGAGTLSEISFAWTYKRLVIAYDCVDGWSAKVAGTKLDDKFRYPFEDKIYAASSPDEAIKILLEKLPLYTAEYTGIRFGE